LKFLDKQSRRILRREFFETANSDPYGIREFKTIGTIVDIGANVGMFSMQSRFIHPTSRIVAIEPDLEVYEILLDNVDNLLIETNRAMLGTDGFGTCLKGRRSVGYRCEQSDESVDVDSLSLPSIVSLYDIDIKNSFFKIDCEGGERVLVESKESLDILSNSLGFGMEIHNRPYFKFWNELLSSISDSFDIDIYTRSAMHVKARRIIK